MNASDHRPATPLEELIVANLMRDTLNHMEIAPRAPHASSGALDAPWAEGRQHDALMSSTILGSKQEQQDPIFTPIFAALVTPLVGAAAAPAVGAAISAIASIAVVPGLQVRV